MPDLEASVQTSYTQVWRDELIAVISQVFEVQGVTTLDGGTSFQFIGRLLSDSEQAYDFLFERLRPMHFLPLFRKQGDTHIILVTRGTLPEAKQRVWLAGGLFLATVASVFFAGLLQSPGATFQEAAINSGMFTVALLTILVAHEMGHYLVSRHYQTPVSLPYFIPAPIFLFGTMGAVINMVAPPKNRRQWLHIAAAGPLAGLVFAIPITYIGLLMSHVEPLPLHGGYIMEGNSLLYLGMKYLVFGRMLPSGGEDVFLHTVAWAGWGGLLVTMLNLIPAAQLDGGHVARALLGARGGQLLTYAIIGTLLVMGYFLWQGWILWALIIFFFSRFQVMPLDDISEPRPIDKLMAGVMLIIFVLLFTPVPLKVVQ